MKHIIPTNDSETLISLINMYIKNTLKIEDNITKIIIINKNHQVFSNKNLLFLKNKVDTDKLVLIKGIDEIDTNNENNVCEMIIEPSSI